MGCLAMLLLLATPSLLCFGLAIMSGASSAELFMWLIVANFIFMFAMAVASACNEVDNPQKKNDAIKQQKRQEKYDNEWGTIDFKEK